MKKKILVLSLVVSLVAITALGVTLAYFTATRNVTNTFTMGNIDIELAEPKWSSTTQFPGVTAVEPQGGWGSAIATPLMPGDVAPKDPQVKNTGDHPAYILLALESTIDINSTTDAFVLGNSKLAGNFGGTLLNNDNWYVVHAEAIPGSYTTILIYGKTLAKNEVTSAPFTSIGLPTDFTKEDRGDLDGFSIKVTAHAIQVDNLTPTQAIDALFPDLD